MEYDESILAFTAYFHDVAAYPYYSSRFSGAYDHTLESGKLIPEIAVTSSAYFARI